ncbi:MAG: preprotein translocase subunit SecY [Candidatus Diapherotrites archaeon]|nr:preprotein translocase subunit SecY [Candidatus Diapherotrites archaeon]
MALEFLDPVIQLLPEVKKPAQKPEFKKRIMWVVAGIMVFFILGQISPFGLLTPAKLEEIRTENPGMYAELAQQYEDVLGRVGFLERVHTILASKIGSLATLGIGPIVMSSIILQLLSGAELIHIDKEKYQGVQKLFAILFCFFEAGIYVFSGFLPIMPSGVSLLPLPIIGELFKLNHILVLTQISIGSIILLYLDEVISKYGFGSGIGLFIVAGVSQSIIFRAFDPVAGLVPTFITQTINAGIMDFDLIAPLLFTILVFLVVVYAEAMRIEIPLTLGRIRGVGGRYPLKFFYVSNLPVILAAALFANVQLFSSVLNGLGFPLLGTFGPGGNPLPELVLSLNPAELSFPIAYLVQAPYGIIGTSSAINQYILNPTYTLLGIIPLELVHLLLYSIILVMVCVVFGMFWVETTGMGPSQVAEQLQNVGFSVPGFRRDKRVIERVLERYIPIITIVGSGAVGLLAAFADITGALGTGTGILLSVGILYRLYEELAQSQLMEMHPALKQFFG